MKYIKIIDQENHIYPYDLNNLKIDYPNTSFSPNTNLNEFGIYIIYDTPKPDDQTKKYTETLVYENNQWKINWIVEDKTTEELKSMKLNELNQQKQIDLINLQKEIILTNSQLATTNEDIEIYKNLYPLWDEKIVGYQFTVNFKVNFIDDLANVRLFKCIQAHQKQITYLPTITPALWSEIIIGSGGIEVWTQPTGGDGKYPYLDPLSGLPYKVTHNGSTWVNSLTSGLNVWEPSVYGWTLD